MSRLPALPVFPPQKITHAIMHQQSITTRFLMMNPENIRNKQVQFKQKQFLDLTVKILCVQYHEYNYVYIYIVVVF